MQKFSLKHCLWLYLFSWPRFTTKWSSIQKCKQPKKPILIMTSQLLMLMLWLKYNNLYILRKDHDFSMKKKILNCVSETVFSEVIIFQRIIFISSLYLSSVIFFHMIEKRNWCNRICCPTFTSRSHTHKERKGILEKKALKFC